MKLEVNIKNLKSIPDLNIELPIKKALRVHEWVNPGQWNQGKHCLVT
jgi:hypothetical protein